MNTDSGKLSHGIFYSFGIRIRAPALLAKPSAPMSLTVTPAAQDNPERRLRFGDWLLDPARHALQHRDGRTAALGTTAITLLEVFAAHPSTPLSREELSTALGREYIAYDRLIDVLVSQIRRKLGRTAEGKVYIRTLRSVGYVFIAPVDPE
jgi:DNA-binding response OmpR family regulator